MARNSRIPHPQGETFLQIHGWAVRAVGRDAAAVLGHLDFLDRAQDRAGAILASRSRLLADLEGLVTRYALDNSLAKLEKLGWIGRHEREVHGGRNLSVIHEYSLCSDAITAHLRNQNTDVLNPERRCSEFGTDNRTDNRTDGGTPSVDKKELEVAAPPDDSSAKKKRGDEVVRNGVELWTAGDFLQHQALIDEHGAAQIEMLAAGLGVRNGHHAPLVSDVRQAFKDKERKALEKARLEAEEKKKKEHAKTVLPRSEQRKRLAVAQGILRGAPA